MCRFPQRGYRSRSWGCEGLQSEGACCLLWCLQPNCWRLVLWVWSQLGPLVAFRGGRSLRCSQSLWELLRQHNLVCRAWRRSGKTVLGSWHVVLVGLRVLTHLQGWGVVGDILGSYREHQQRLWWLARGCGSTFVPLSVKLAWPCVSSQPAFPWAELPAAFLWLFPELRVVVGWLCSLKSPRRGGQQFMACFSFPVGVFNAYPTEVKQGCPLVLVCCKPGPKSTQAEMDLGWVLVLSFRTHIAKRNSSRINPHFACI